jgi:hypothetical protein
LYVRAILRGGHVGRGKYFEMTRYLEINGMLDMLTLARKMPRVKKGHLALISCEQINRSEYSEGKRLEAQDPYLNTFKNRKGGYSFAQRLHGNTA